MRSTVLHIPGQVEIHIIPVDFLVGDVAPGWQTQDIASIHKCIHVCMHVL